MPCNKMKVVLYMAMSVNGYIAKSDNQTPWSTEEWHSFSAFVKEAGNIIVGRKTYEIMKASDELPRLGNPFVVVISKDSFVHNDSVTLTHSPQSALQIIKNKKCTTALVAGGSTLNSSFLKDNLIDELILDLEPVLFGRGIPLFSYVHFTKKLELINTKKISDHTIQLHYKIIN